MSIGRSFRLIPRDCLSKDRHSTGAVQCELTGKQNAFNRSNDARPEIRMQAQAAWLKRIQVGSRGQMMAFGADIRNIQQHLPAQLPLQSKRPSLGIWEAEIFFERAGLRIQKTGWARRRDRKLLEPVRIAPSRTIGRALIDRDGVGR